ncbi:hypothetical protein TNCV_2281391 [Trichonephila clavipes]|nr:hypothetical protein TNCV_2281391 [Trichonephila clavipes]
MGTIPLDWVNGTKGILMSPISGLFVGCAAERTSNDENGIFEGVCWIWNKVGCTKRLFASPILEFSPSKKHLMDFEAKDFFGPQMLKVKDFV